MRAARPFTDDLRLAARDVDKATPDLDKALEEANRFFNMGAYNPGGAESLAGLSVPSSAPATRASSTGWPGPPRTASRCSTPPTPRDRGGG